MLVLYADLQLGFHSQCSQLFILLDECDGALGVTRLLIMTNNEPLSTLTSRPPAFSKISSNFCARMRSPRTLIFPDIYALMPTVVYMSNSQKQMNQCDWDLTSHAKWAYLVQKYNKNDPQPATYPPVMKLTRSVSST